MAKKNLRKFITEDGNSFLLFIFLMPVLAGAFGLGLDTAMGQYTRTGIQNAADTATVAGAAMTKYSGNNRVIDKAAATQRVREIYLSQRQSYPNITGSSPTITVTLVRGRSGASDTLQVSIQEKSPTLFLHMAGVNEFNYNIQSQARLGYVAESR